jgi:hypothetical protein
LHLKEIKWSGINACGSVDSEGVGKERFLLSGNSIGNELLAGISGTARRRRMSFEATDNSYVPISVEIITYWYWLSSINYKLLVWRDLREGRGRPGR